MLAEKYARTVVDQVFGRSITGRSTCCRRVVSWFLGAVGIACTMAAQETPVDSDGDGHPDEVELQLGTDPTSSESVLRLRTPLVSLPEGEVRISWESVVGREYRLERARFVPLEGEVPWEFVDALTAVEPVSSLVDRTGGDERPRFYRIVAVLQAEPDPDPEPTNPQVPGYAGGGLRLPETLPPGTDPASVRVDGAGVLPTRVEQLADDSYSVSIDRPSGANLVARVRVLFNDALGNEGQSDAVWVVLLDPDRFLPLDEAGLPVPGQVVGVDAEGRLLPFEYRPTGRRMQGGDAGFFIRFPEGARLLADNGGDRLEFSSAYAGFGDRSPLRFEEPLLREGAGTASLALGPISLGTLREVFSVDAEGGFPVRAFDAFKLSWVEGVLTDDGIEDAMFLWRSDKYPMPRDPEQTQGFRFDWDREEGLRIPLAGSFVLPDSSANPVGVSVPASDPLWVTLRPGGQISLQGRVQGELPGGGRFSGRMRLDDPVYEVTFAAERARFDLLGGLADTLPPDPAQCLAIPSENLVFDCLESHWEAYRNFLAELGHGEGPTGGFVGSVLRAQAHSVRAGAAAVTGLSAELARLERGGLATARDLETAVETVESILGLLTAAEENAEDPTVPLTLREELNRAISDAVLLIREDETPRSRDKMLRVTEAILRAEALAQTLDEGGLDLLYEDLPELYAVFLRHWSDRLGVKTSVWEPDENPVIAEMNRFVALEHISDLGEIIDSLVALSLFDPGTGNFLNEDAAITGPRVAEMLTQLGIRLGEETADRVQQAIANQDPTALAMAITDLTEIVALQEVYLVPAVNRGQLSEAVLGRLPNVNSISAAAEELGILLEADLQRPYADRSVGNLGNEVGLLLEVLEGVPDEVSFPFAPIERALARLDEVLIGLVETISVVESPDVLIDAIQAGIRRERLAAQFDIALGTTWTTSQLPALAERLVALTSLRLDWGSLSEACEILLQDARSRPGSGNGAPMATLLGGMRLIADGAWDLTRAEWDEHPEWQLADLLLPGDVLVDNLAGGFRYDRQRKDLDGAFRGAMRLPKFSSALTISSARVGSGVRFELNAYGQTTIPLQNPVMTLSVPPRRPLRVETGPDGLAVSGGVQVDLPNGVGFEAHMTWDDPLYGFGLMAKSLNFDLPGQAVMLAPVLPDVQGATREAFDRLTEYYGNLNATLETLAPLGDRLDIAEPGEAPNYTVPPLNVSFAPTETLVNRLGMNFVETTNPELVNLGLALKEQMANANRAVGGLRTNLVAVQARSLEIHRVRELAERIQELEEQDEATFENLEAELLGSVEAQFQSATNLLAAAQTVDSARYYEQAIRAGIAAAETQAITNGDQDLVTPLAATMAVRRNQVLNGIHIDPNSGAVLDEVAFGELDLVTLREASAQISATVAAQVLVGETLDGSFLSSAFFRALVRSDIAISQRVRERLLAEYLVLETEDWKDGDRLLGELIAVAESLQESKVLAETYDAGTSRLDQVSQFDGSQGPFDPEVDFDVIQQEYERWILAREADLALQRSQSLAGFYRRLVLVTQRTGRAWSAPVVASLEREWSLRQDQWEEYWSQDLSLDRLNQALHWVGAIEQFTRLASEVDIPQVPAWTQLNLPTFTVRFADAAKAAQAWWLLQEYAIVLSEALRERGEQGVDLVGSAIRESLGTTIGAARDLASTLYGLIPETQPVDVQLPGDLKVKYVFGDLLYNRETENLRLSFGGRLELPDLDNAYFELEEATLNTAGNLVADLKTGGPVPFAAKGVTLHAVGRLAMDANRSIAIDGGGALRLPGSPDFAVGMEYRQQFSDEGEFQGFTLGLDTGFGIGNPFLQELELPIAAEDEVLELAEDFVIAGASIGMTYSSENPLGELRVGGTAGWFRRPDAAGGEAAPLEDQFFLTVEDFRGAIQTDFDDEYLISVNSGTLQLPEYFARSDEANDAPTIDVAGKGLELRISEVEGGLVPGVSFSGELLLENLRAMVPDLPFIYGDLDRARLRFSSSNVPEFESIEGSLHVGLKGQELVVGIDANWRLDGFPSGTISLEEDLTVFESSGFKVSMVGGESVTCEDGDCVFPGEIPSENVAATGITIYPTDTFGSPPAFRVDTGIRMTLPSAMLKSTEDAELADGQSVDSEGNLSVAVCGAMKVEADDNGFPLPSFCLETLEFTASELGFGDSDTFTLRNVLLRASGLNALLSGFENGDEFKLTYGGTADIDFGGDGGEPNRLEFGFGNAQIIYNGEELPRIIPPESAEINVENLRLIDQLPVKVTKAKVELRNNELPFRDLVSLDNVKLTISASVELPARDPVLAGRFDALEFYFEDGQPQPRFDGVGIEINTFDIPPLSLGGAVYIGGLKHLRSDPPRPDKLFFTGRLGGNVGGGSVWAQVAFTPRELKGICFDASAGPAGIPIGNTSFIFNGASGGVSLLNSNADPCDFGAFYPMDVEGRPLDDDSVDNALAPQSLGLQGRLFEPSGMSWEAVSASVHRIKEREILAAEQREVERRFGLKRMSETEAPLSFEEIGEIPCPTGDCPPPSVNILCQPHPDIELYPHRVIAKFSSLSPETTLRILRSVLNLGDGVIEPEAVESYIAANGIDGLTLDVANAAADFLRPLFTGVETVLGEAAAAAIEDQLDRVKTRFAADLAEAIRIALDDPEDDRTILQAILDAGYAGIACPDLTVKVQGSFTQAGVSGWLNVVGGGVFSTTGAVGLVGGMRIFGIEVGHFDGFFIGTDSNGEPNPSLCGDLELIIGPLSASEAKVAYTCEGCTTRFSQAFSNLAACLLSPTSEIAGEAIDFILARVAPELFAQLGRNALLALDDVQKAGFMAEVFSRVPENASFSSCFRDFFVSVLEGINPELQFCAEGAKIFGFDVPLGFGSPFTFREARFAATKNQLAGGAVFSPTKLLSLMVSNWFLLGFVFDNLPQLDNAAFGMSTSYPDPTQFLLDGLNGEFENEESLLDYGRAAFLDSLENTAFPFSYQWFPFGIETVNLQGRFIPPNLVNHPLAAGSQWNGPPGEPGPNGELPETDVPSRVEVLLAARETEQSLASPLWHGDAEDLHQIFDPQSAEAAVVRDRQLSLLEDYFPHGGFVGAGLLAMPNSMAESNPPVWSILEDDSDGRVGQLQRLGAYIQENILGTTEMGELAFYLPAPNPPLLATLPDEVHDPLDLWQSLGQIIPEQFENLPEIYSGQWGFVSGRFNGQLLGIDFGDAIIEGQGGDLASGEGGQMIIRGQGNADSWVAQLLGFSMPPELTAVLTSPTPRPPRQEAEALIAAIRSVEALGETGISETSFGEIRNQLLGFYTDHFPKASFQTKVEDWAIPPLLVDAFAGTDPLFDVTSSLELRAYTPFFDPDVEGENPLARVQREGGIMGRYTGSIGGLFDVVNLELGVTYGDVLPGQVTPFPGLAGETKLVSARESALPLRDLTLHFHTAPITALPNIEVSGVMDPITLPLTGLTLRPLDSDASTLSGRVVLGRDEEGEMQAQYLASPAVIEGSFLPLADSPQAPRLILHGATRADDFSYSIDGPWSQSVTVENGLRIVETASFGLLSIPDTSAVSVTFTGDGLSGASIEAVWDDPVSLNVFPDAAFALPLTLQTGRFAIDKAGNIAAFTGELVGDLALELAGALPSFIRDGATVSLSDEGLTFTGTITGELFEDDGLDASLTVTRQGGVVGGISIGVIEVGRMRISEKGGGPLRAQIVGPIVRVDGQPVLAFEGFAELDLPLAPFDIAADGSFLAGVTAGRLEIADYFALDGGAMEVRRDSTGALSFDVRKPSLVVFPESPVYERTFGFEDATAGVSLQPDGTFAVNLGDRTLSLPGLEEGVADLKFGFETELRAPEIVVAQDPLNFGAVPLGEQRDLTLKVRNSGNAHLVFSATTDSGAFLVTGGTFGLDAQESVDLTVRYRPQAPEASEATLTIASSDFDPETGSHLIPIELSGSAFTRPQFELSANTLRFGTVPLERESSLELLLSNAGSAASELQPPTIDGPFEISDFPTSLAAKTSRRLHVTFRPEALGDHTGSIEFVADGQVQSISLSGEAVGQQWYVQVGPEAGQGAMVDLEFRDRLNGAGVTDRGAVLVTDDGGLTWRSRKVSSETLNGIHFAGDQYFVCGDGGMLFVSSDEQGSSWRIEADESVFDGGVDWQDVAMVDGKLHLVGVARSGGGRMVRQNSLGEFERVETVESGGGLYGIESISLALVAVGEEGALWHSTDSGESWRDRRSDLPVEFQGENFFDVGMRSTANWTIVGSNGAILQTPNATQFWIRFRGGFGVDLRSVNIDGRYGFAVGPNSRLYETDETGASWRQVTGDFSGDWYAVAGTEEELWVGGDVNDVSSGSLGTGIVKREEQVPSDPFLTASTSELAFETVSIGERSRRQDLYLRNPGPAEVRVRFPYAPSSFYAAEEELTIPSGAYRAVPLYFQPSAGAAEDGLVEEELTFTVGPDNDERKIPLRGRVSEVEWLGRPSGVTEDLLGVQLLSSRDAYAYSSERVIRTRDGGDTWIVGDIVPGIDVIRSAHFRTLEEGWVAGEVRGAAVILRTTDGANTWRREFLPGGPNVDVPQLNFGLDTSVGWALAERSDGSLRAWRRDAASGRWLARAAVEGLDRNSVLSAVNATQSYLINGHQLLRSTNGGTSFRTVLEGPTSIALLAGLNFGQLGMVGGRDGLFLRSENAVANSPTWEGAEQFSSGSIVRLVSSSYNDGFALVSTRNGSEVFRTADGGQAWVSEGLIQPSNVRDLAVPLQVADTAIAVGDQGNVWVRREASVTPLGMGRMTGRYDYGSVGAGQLVYAEIAYRNVGKATLKVDAVTIKHEGDKNPFRSPDYDTTTLEPGEVMTIRVGFQAFEYDRFGYRAVLQVYSDGFDGVSECTLSGNVLFEPYSLMLDSEPSGVDLTLRTFQQRTTPLAIPVYGENTFNPDDWVVGNEITIEAPELVVRDGVEYVFDSWGNNEARVFNLRIPSVPTTLTARYRARVAAKGGNGLVSQAALPALVRLRAPGAPDNIPTGPWVRFSEGAFALPPFGSESLRIPEGESIFASLAAASGGLESTGFVFPDEEISSLPWFEMNPSRFSFDFERGGPTSLEALSGAVRLFGLPLWYESITSLVRDRNGDFRLSSSIEGTFNVLPSIVALQGSNATPLQWALSKEGDIVDVGFEGGKLLFVQKPGGGYLFEQDLSSINLVGDTENRTLRLDMDPDALPEILPDWTFFGIQGIGDGPQFVLRQDNSGSWLPEIEDLGLRFFGKTVTESLTPDPEGWVSANLPDGAFNAFFPFDVRFTRAPELKWNWKTGEFSVALSGIRAKGRTFTQWGDTEVNFAQAFEIDSNGNFKVEIDEFNLTLFGVKMQSVNDDSYMRLERRAGGMEFAMGTEVSIGVGNIGEMSMEMSSSGAVTGRISVGYTGWIFDHYVEDYPVTLKYGSNRESYPFRAEVLGGAFRMKWGPADGLDFDQLVF